MSSTVPAARPAGQTSPSPTAGSWPSANVDGPAAKVVDAVGKVVAPGFVDVHTHYDAQVFWDSTLAPSPLHGVTTAIAGNCGFTIAPLSGDPSDAEYLMRMLARVEGMPLEALRDGVPWSWLSTQEYFDSFEGNLGINAGFKIGHSAIRRTVMGADASARAATSDEIDAMTALLRAGLEAGGIGFSSSWARTHADAEGAMVPSRNAVQGRSYSRSPAPPASTRAPRWNSSRWSGRNSSRGPSSSWRI